MYKRTQNLQDIFVCPQCCWRVGEMHTASVDAQYRGTNGAGAGATHPSRDKVAILDAGSQYGKVRCLDLVRRCTMMMYCNTSRA